MSERLKARVRELEARVRELETENTALRAFAADESVLAFIRDQARAQADDPIKHVRAIVLAERPELAGLLDLLDRKLAERRVERDKARPS